MLSAKLAQKRSESVNRREKEANKDLKDAEPALSATHGMPPKGYAGLQSMPDPNSVAGLHGAACIPFAFTAKSSKGASRPQLETRNMLERIQS